MTSHPHKPTHLPAHLLFLFSDTGGGHRSAAEAIIEALCLEYGDRISTSMVDVFKDYAPRPLNRVPDLYPHMVRVPRAWGLSYRLSDGHRRARLITASTWPYLRSKIRSLILQHPSDLIVSVHPLANAPALRALRTLGTQEPPFITVVTDLVTTHALWYHRRADLCLVPTYMAYQRALECGMKPKQLQVTGLPVADRFCKLDGDRHEIRRRLGWPDGFPVILLVGGGEGMGPLEKTARAIDAADLQVSLVVVAGRNRELQSRLERQSWSIPIQIYGFVKEMPDFMQAADILVTKAGPGTISEAFNAGLPMILYSRLPGQEDGNVGYVTSQGAGVWAPRPELIVAAVKNWIDHPEKLNQAAQASRRLARPDAARRIARILAAQVGAES
jgi:1,2-diacylglycerol 3-beta-galactosyltransferase